MTQAEALPTMFGPRWDAAESFPIPVLIRVPGVKAHRPRRNLGFLGTAVRSRPSRRLKRRLRREVRLAASAMLAFLGMGLAWELMAPRRIELAPSLMVSPSWLSAGLTASPPAAPSDGERALSASLPSVLLSIEAVGTAADADAEAPVVFPGYLLPADTHEEAVHEGG